jgi:hypothetical protein
MDGLSSFDKWYEYYDSLGTTIPHRDSIHDAFDAGFAVGVLNERKRITDALAVTFGSGRATALPMATATDERIR